MRIEHFGSLSVQYLEAVGPVISTGQDAADLIGDAWGHSANFIAIPLARLDPEFFRLRSGVAGDITQKFANYRMHLAVLGDIAEQVAASDALRDFVRESNRGGQVWFLPDEAALVEKLTDDR